MSSEMSFSSIAEASNEFEPSQSLENAAKHSSEKTPLYQRKFLILITSANQTQIHALKYAIKLSHEKPLLNSRFVLAHVVKFNRKANSAMKRTVSLNSMLDLEDDTLTINKEFEKLKLSEDILPSVNGATPQKDTVVYHYCDKTLFLKSKQGQKNFVQNFIKKDEEVLKDFKSVCLEAGVDFSVILVYAADVKEAAVKLVKKIGPKMVVVTHKRSNYLRYTFSDSIANYLRTKIRVPLLVINKK